MKIAIDIEDAINSWRLTIIDSRESKPYKINPESFSELVEELERYLSPGKKQVI